MGKKRILIVDDSEFDRKMMSNFLKEKGFDTVTLDSGDKCIETVKLKKPDVVLLDILMPNLHGKQVLHMLREKYSSVELPILMITVKTEVSDVIEALSLGANDYITKPLDFDIALMRINTHLKIVDQNKELVRLKQLESVGAMITTYNHEINSPLSVALGAMKGLESQRESKNYKRLESALWKIADIVKKIGEVTHKGGLELTSYSKTSKLIKIK